jgi:hypothetical protein
MPYDYQQSRDALRARVGGLMQLGHANAAQFAKEKDDYEKYLRRVSETQEAAAAESKKHSMISAGVSILGGVVGGVAGAFAGGPMGAMAGASAGSALGKLGADWAQGDATGGEAVQTISSVAPAIAGIAGAASNQNPGGQQTAKNQMALSAQTAEWNTMNDPISSNASKNSSIANTNKYADLAANHSPNAQPQTTLPPAWANGMTPEQLAQLKMMFPGRF